METETVNEESLSGVLRSISQRQRQGVLDISFGSTSLSVSFSRGKIVEAVEDGKNPVIELAELMKNAGLISGTLPEGWDESYQNFYIALCEKQAKGRVIEEELFRRFIRHRVLDKLYRCLRRSGGACSFHVESVEYDKSLSPVISVGQLLLDLVALDADAGRFSSLFTPDTVISYVLQDSPAHLNPEQVLICRLAKRGITLKELKRKSLLSYYHLQDGLLALYDKGMLELGDLATESRGSSDTRASSPSGQEGEELDSSLDDVLNELESSLSKFDSQIISRRMLADMDRIEERISSKDGSSDRPAAKEKSTAAESGGSDSSAQVPEDERLESIGGMLGIGPESYKILDSPWVVNTMIVLFIALALILPRFAWFEAVGYFAY